MMMGKRMVSIWFPLLEPEQVIRRRSELREVPFVLAAKTRGRLLVQAASRAALKKGIHPGMELADSRAILPELLVLPHAPEKMAALLKALGEWCIRFTPEVSPDGPDGLILDATGCCHLWGGEARYLASIRFRLGVLGFTVRLAIADTPGAAWALARFGRDGTISGPGQAMRDLRPLPSEALRVDPSITEQLCQLGLRKMGNLLDLPLSALRRRFDHSLVQRIQELEGSAPVRPEPLRPPEPFEERLPCPEPIRTAIAIETGLRQLLDRLCLRLRQEGRGLRKALLEAFRVDGVVCRIGIGLHRPSHDPAHLMKLFAWKIPDLEPGLGFELLILKAPVTDPLKPRQDPLWKGSPESRLPEIGRLLDRIRGKSESVILNRYLPSAHHWPERSFRRAASLEEGPEIPWPVHLPRPLYLLRRPEPIRVTVPLPDYPPMLFLHQGRRHVVRKADGPERIEKEWWIDQACFRDYYCVEDEEGGRYWLFRAGGYEQGHPGWYLHGYFP